MKHVPALLLIAAVAGSLALPATAGTLSTPACKRDLARTWNSLDAALARLKGLASMPQEQKCAAIANQRETAIAAREVFARCHTGQEHAESLRNVDEVLDGVRQTYNRVCPPRPGLVRVNMVMTQRITPEEMPQPVRNLHTCDMEGRISFMNEPFDDGRIMLAGCRGAAASEAEVKRRNVSAAAASGDQVRVYLTLDASGRGARQLSFPVRSADGGEATVDALPEAGTMPTGRNAIVANWAPATSDVCRIHAEWRVDPEGAGKASLVLWQEALDCPSTGAPEFRTVLDRRAQK